MTTRRLPARQVHLDFHTSEHIPGVGGRFDKAQFQDALQAGRVNLINLFAKCHHSWSYYPTQVGMVHPTLEIDLLGGQIEACHEIGVRCPVYFTVGWSANDAEMHPEWCMRHADGSIVISSGELDAPPDAPRPFYSWKLLCPSGAYHELVMAQTEEICRSYDVDGMWYDIYQSNRLCYCETCRAGMKAEGLNVDDEADVRRYRALCLRRHMSQVVELVHGIHPEAVTFFNGLTTLDRPENHTFRLYEFNTQNDLEDLPTTWGGYDKLPLRARYFQNVGRPIVAMSGKFHTAWGEFGGFKHPDAIRFEAASMVAYGAACNFGDQLHPLGEMDMDTYRNIGRAYEYVEQIEDYGVGADGVARLGLWYSGSGADDEGAASMLLETQTDFLVVDPEGDWSHLEAIVLPGAACLTDEQAARLDAFAAAGGGLLVLGASAMDAAGERFILDVGADYVGPGQYDVDYLAVQGDWAPGLVTSPFLNNAPALRVQAHDGAEVLARIHEPYFSRTYARYCSHRNTPYRPEPAAHPGVVRAGDVVYCAHALGRLYHRHGARLHRDLFTAALGLVYTRPMIRAELPSAGRVTLLHQPEHKRYVAHLLYGPPLQRGECLVIEDLPALADVAVKVDVPETIRTARLVPGGGELTVERTNSAVKLTVPRVHCHQAVVLEY